jgi:glycosyltransferase involved in cell wall biosynthesis
MTESLAGRYDFRILAKPGIGLGDAVESPRGRSEIRRYLLETRHDLVLLSSFFDREYTMPILQLRRLGLVPRSPAFLSPRGEFSPGALALKSRRKAAYLALARRAGLLRGVWLHATSEAERADIERAFPGAAGYVTAHNIRAMPSPLPHVSSAGVLRLAFIGRIAPVKGLEVALRALAGVAGKVDFDIYGPAEDRTYWAACRRVIASLPDNVRVRHHGEIANADVPARLAACDLFFLPSVSENFGHAIFEALSCGVPVLIGDRTPWRELQRLQAGWDVPLSEPWRLTAAIEEMAALDPRGREALRRGARALAIAQVAGNDAARETIEMLDAGLARGGAAESARLEVA